MWQARLAPPAAILAAWALAPGAACAQSLYVIPTDSHAPVLASVQPLRVVLHARDPDRLAKRLGAGPPAAGTDSIGVVLDSTTSLRGLPDRSWLDATFVLDFHDSGVAKLSAAFEQSLGRKPAADEATRAALVEFVAASLKPSSSRSFDIASEIAVRREGDCTEFAVLTATLARAAGIPARVALGVALVAEAQRFGAYGHAWAELQIGGKWVVADAALAKTKRPVWYLPIGVLQDEGMGYALDVAGLTPVWVQRIEVLGAVQ